MNPSLACTVTCGRASIAIAADDGLFELVDAVRCLIETIETGQIPDYADEEEADFVDAALEHIIDEGGNITEPVWLGIRSQSDDFDIPIWEGCYMRDPHTARR